MNKAIIRLKNSLNRGTQILFRCDFHTSDAINQHLEEKVILTKDRYPNMKRGKFAELQGSHIQHFINLLGPTRVLTDPNDVEPYNIDWIKVVRGYSGIVLKPKTTQEVSEILKFCNSERLAVCTQGGNTGLVGGSVPVFDEVMRSMSLMNKVIDINPLSGTVLFVSFSECRTVWVYEVLLTRISFDLPSPPPLPAACLIAMIFTSESAYVLFFTHLLDLTSKKNGFPEIDAALRPGEGGAVEFDCTLVTGRSKVALPPSPIKQVIVVGWIMDDSFKNVLNILQLAKSCLSEILSSCEMIDDPSISAVIRNLGVNSPIGQFPFYVLIETSGSHTAHDEEKLNAFLEKAMAESYVLDGTVTNEPSRMQVLWQLRERIAEALLKDGPVYKYDVSLPVEHFYGIVPLLQEKLRGTSAEIVTGYGHI
ncbi:hypothetical protein LSTR_LSTR014480, partial [Laodelphax striatellus]